MVEDKQHAGSPPAATGAKAQQNLARYPQAHNLVAPQLWCIGGPGETGYQCQQRVRSGQQPEKPAEPVPTQDSISHQPLLLPLHPPKSTISTQISCAGLPKLKRALPWTRPCLLPICAALVGTRYLLSPLPNILGHCSLFLYIVFVVE